MGGRKLHLLNIKNLVITFVFLTSLLFAQYAFAIVCPAGWTNTESQCISPNATCGINPISGNMTFCPPAPASLCVVSPMCMEPECAYSIRSSGTCTASGGKAGTCQTDGTCLPACTPTNPSTETCDGKDNDCNGFTDNLSPKSCSVANSYGTCTGTQSCSGGAWGICNAKTPASEKCDNIDNDCDGSIDEGFTKGTACTVGVGACLKSGTTVCKADGSGTQCSATAGAPGTETCNGIDDDCDSSIDENGATLCGDGNACTTDSCSNGTCSNAPISGCATCTTSADCTASDACHVSTCVKPGRTATGTCTETVAANGTTCSDGNGCTSGDVCQSGVCTAGSSVSCSDGLSCTTDQCVPGSHGAHTCSNSVSTGCVIGGVCVAEGASNPSNPCQACRPATSKTSWSNALNGVACTSDGLSCTSDVCSAGTCTHPVTNGCLVGGVCYGAGINSPANQCQVCNPAYPTVWSQKSASATCNDGESCTSGDTCSGAGGTCKGTPYTCTAKECESSSVCNGSGGCTVSYRPSNYQCRNETGVCDKAENCTGMSGTCPADQCLSSGTVVPGGICEGDCSPPVECLNNADCYDGSECTIDQCDIGTNSCSHIPKTCNDSNACTTDSCDPATPGGCVYTDNTASCNDGNVCTSGDICSGGSCAGTAVKCETPPSSCHESVGTCGATGCTYTLKPTGGTCSTGLDGACSEGASQCVNNEFVCQQTTQSSTEICDDIDNDCDGLADDNPTGAPSGGVMCKEWACSNGTWGLANSPAGAPCTDFDKCTQTDTCNGAGACIGSDPLQCADDGFSCTEESCNANFGCLSIIKGGFCLNDGGCYQNGEQNPANPCEICSISPSGKVQNVWSYAPAGTACSGDGNDCTDDVCNATGSCKHNNNTAPCDDGNLCTENDLCAGGSCRSGAAKNCNDGNACNGVETCDLSIGCKEGAALVYDDGDLCTIDTCDPATGPVHTAKNCADTDLCTADSCDGTTGECKHLNIAEDNNACTLDACVNGNVFHMPKECNDNNDCTIDSCDPVKGCQYTCENKDTITGTVAAGGYLSCPGGCVPPVTIECVIDADCSDGNACTGLEKCQAGVCVAGQSVAVPKATSCQSFSCDPITGLVVTANTNEGTIIESYNDCGQMVCRNGLAVTEADPLAVCGDDNVCMTYKCDATTAYQCTSARVADNTFILAVGECARIVCKGGNPAPEVDAGKPCPAADQCNSSSICDIKSGNCQARVPLADGTECEDGKALTINDICTGGLCGGTPVDCVTSTDCRGDKCGTTACVANKCQYTPTPIDDGNPCTSDSCDPATGLTHTPINEGGVVETIGDCVRSVCKSGDPVPEIDPARPCPAADQCNNASACDIKSGICQARVSLADGIKCGDGSVCNGMETCQAGVCTAGKTLSCDDGNACTDDTCDPVVGCKYSNNTSSCEDGNKCNGPESCQGGFCTNEGKPLSCDDGNVCTNDTCDVKVGCQYQNNTLSCSDSDACTDRDYCLDGSCRSGVMKTCAAPTDICHGAASCSSVSGECVYPVVSASKGCSVSNEYGTCGGSEVCSGSGDLSACDAKEANQCGICGGPDLGMDAGGVCGVCNDGTNQCVGGAIECVGAATEDSDGNGVPDKCDVEVCDGKDNNGDGNVDEGFDKDNDGITSCGGDCNDDDPNIKPGALEVCDAAKVDENCNGSANENCDCVEGESKDCGSSVGECRPGKQVCELDIVGIGRWSVCRNAITPMPEICDGKDNDCNGIADDIGGVVDVDQDGLSVLCGDCNDNDAEINPSASEMCDANQVDENCNETANEGCLCNEGDTQSCGRTGGKCMPGVQTCLAGQWGDCVGAVGPESEVCNGADDDCNGIIDDIGGVLDADNDGYSTCSDCNDNDRTVNPGAAEVCDGKDNDCNNVVDEGFGDASCGVGACANRVPICLNGAPNACQPLDVTSAELCDNLDNNCDGNVDEGLGELSCGIGVCAKKVPACVGGIAGVCDPNSGSVPEVCDNIDNDCDGIVDDFERACSNSCGSGVERCVAGQWSACTAPEPSEETCNGRDDNCNGAVDEGMASEICGVGACQKTVLTCLSGAVNKCVPGTPMDEICDGIDNDCDGEVDEGLGNITCGENACKQTVPACVSGKPNVCDPSAGAKPEVCDGIDNNCNGSVDEGLGVFTCGEGSCAKTMNRCDSGVIRTETECLALVSGNICDDGSACTDPDSCNAQGVCSGTLKTCDDGNLCTTDSCDAATGECKAEEIACADSCHTCKAETGKCDVKDDIDVNTCLEAEKKTFEGNSNIFELSKTLGFYVPFAKINSTKVYKNLVVIDGCNETSCGIAMLDLSKLSKPAGAAEGIEKGVPKQEDAVEFFEDKAQSGKALVGLAKIASDGDLVTHDDQCIYITPNYSENYASETAEGQTKICLADHGVCTECKISNVSVDPAVGDITITTDTGVTVVFANDQEKKGELVMYTLENVPPKLAGIYIKIGDKDFNFTDTDINSTIGAVFGDGYMKEDPSKIENAFASGDIEPETVNVVVGGVYSIRSGFMNVDEKEALPQMMPYDVSKEQYFCSSPVNNIKSTDMDRFALPSHLTMVDLDRVGGPDLMAACYLVPTLTKADEENTKLGIVEPKAAAIFIYPNINELHTLDIEASGQILADSSGKNVGGEGITLTALGKDVTSDELIYSWKCVDTLGADCDAMLSSLTGETVMLGSEPLALSTNAEPSASKGTDGATSAKCPYTITSTATDASGLAVSKDVTIDCAGGFKAVTAPESAPVTVEAGTSGWGFMSGGGCSLIR